MHPIHVARWGSTTASAPVAVSGPCSARGRNLLYEQVTFIMHQRARLHVVFGAHFSRAPVVNSLRHLFQMLDGGELATPCAALSK